MIAFPPDEGLRRVLSRFDVAPGDHLGNGGEAWVYALDEERVIRVLHDGGGPAGITASQALLAELTASRPPFLTPVVLDVGEVEGRWYAIERRLAGEPVSVLLGRLRGHERDRLIVAHLDAAAALADLHLEPRDWVGELLAPDPVRTSSWQAFLLERAERSLADAGGGFSGVDPRLLAEALPEPDRVAFLHLDAFAGNMLAADGRITAVLDFGATVAVGDGRLDPLAAVVYLEAPEITPNATADDQPVARSWLEDHDLLHMLEPARRWLAAYWAGAVDDPSLHRWCRRTLKAEPS